MCVCVCMHMCMYVWGGLSQGWVVTGMGNDHMDGLLLSGMGYHRDGLSQEWIIRDGLSKE